MFALPVIERELRVRARAKATHWVRILVAIMATLLCFGAMTFASRGRTSDIGRGIFGSLIGLTFVYCLVEGVRQTSDCLSQEKREGTLGLLFLAQLNAFEIVLGKWVATSITSFYGLLATMPMLGIVFLTGGVSGGEFWRNQLVLLHTLFVASACGMAGSAWEREQQRALFAGLKVLFWLCVSPLFLMPFSATANWPMVSPVALLNLTGDMAYKIDASRFWWSLLLMQAVGWWLIVLAGKAIKVNYQNDPVIPVEVTPSAPLLGHPLATSLRETSQVPGDKSQPVEWLARRLPLPRRLIWLSFLVMALPVAQRRFFGRFFLGTPTINFWLTELVPVLLLGTAAVAVFGHAKRSGALELLQSTPLTAREIVNGHWRVIRRVLFGPLVGIGTLMIAMEAVLWATRIANGQFMGMGWSGYDFVTLLAFGGNVLTAMAVWWAGMYFSLRMRTTMQALGQTLLWCSLVPWVLAVMGSQIAMQFGGRGIPMGFTFMNLVPYVVHLVYPIILWRWMRKRVTEKFWDLAMETEKFKA